MIAILSAVAAFAACPSPGPSLDLAETCVVEARGTTATAALEDVVSSFQCLPMMPGLLARYWNATGALASIQGDQDGAALAFAAASRMVPGKFPEAFGPGLREAFDAAATSPPSDGQVKFEPALPGLVYWVDGKRVEANASVPAGLHVVQVGPDAVRIGFGREIVVQSHIATTVTHPVTPKVQSP